MHPTACHPYHPCRNLFLTRMARMTRAKTHCRAGYGNTPKRAARNRGPGAPGRLLPEGPSMKNKTHADLERCAGRGCNQALAGRSASRPGTASVTASTTETGSRRTCGGHKSRSTRRRRSKGEREHHDRRRRRARRLLGSVGWPAWSTRQAMRPRIFYRRPTSISGGSGIANWRTPAAQHRYCRRASTG
jgi:hypothetical protein